MRWRYYLARGDTNFVTEKSDEFHYLTRNEAYVGILSNHLIC